MAIFYFYANKPFNICMSSHVNDNKSQAGPEILSLYAFGSVT